MKNFHNIKSLRSQRGAMFGLDARIALAIFAGLSVIAGMAVFNQISETNTTALVSEFDNISKGYINYAFDTGIDIPVGVGAGQGIRGLWEPTAIGPPATPLGWQGPYITRSTANHPVYGTYEIVQGFIDVAGNDPSASVGGNINGAWLELSNVNCEIAQALDGKVDGEGAATPDDGNVRLPDPCAAGTTGTVYYLLSRTMN